MDIKDIEVTPSYQAVLNFLEAGVPAIFISGKAGTGKSTLIFWLKEILKKRFAVVAPTGVAALNIECQTMHSFFRFPPRFVMENDIQTVYDSVYKKLEVLIIDEISMVRCEQLDAIDLFLRKNGPDANLPFGGVQIIMVGDLFQLPPVVSENEKSLFAKYETSFFFSAKILEQIPYEHIELDHIYRQKDDHFTNILNLIRVGEHIAESIGAINAACLKPITDDPARLTLTATNAVAEAINSAEMAKIKSQEMTYEGEIKGNFNLKDGNLPAPLFLKLKVGAKVMLTKNDEAKRWVNGSMGIVTALDKKWVEVECLTTANSRSSKEQETDLDEDEEDFEADTAPKYRSAAGNPVYRIERAEWGTYRYQAEGDAIVPKRSGSYVQYPLMLAWGVTIHKSQGRTLDKVLIDLGTGAFAPGQVYVGLSRVRNIEDMFLKRAIRVSEVKTDANVKKYFQWLKQVKDANADTALASQIL